MTMRNWALLGGDSLAGKELREAIGERNLPVRLALYTCAPGVAVFTASEDDEAEVIAPFSVAALAGVEVVFLAGDQATCRAAMAQARAAGLHPVWVDLHGSHEDLPESRVRAPLVENPPAQAQPDEVQVVAHPGAALLARFFALLHGRFPLRRAVVTACEPASARGLKGVDELRQQTVNLLAFKSLPQQVFDIQVAFNLLPRYGEAAGAALAGSQARLELHLASLLAPLQVPLPSVKLVHAPVFHGYCFSVWVEFSERPAGAALEKLLREAGLDVRTAELEPPSNVAVAGQSGLTVGGIEDDGNDARATWFFLAGDNLRTQADNAVMIAALGGGAA